MEALLVLCLKLRRSLEEVHGDETVVDPEWLDPRSWELGLMVGEFG
jgi:hypothetical protein